jgi:hypothetical protein
VETLWNLTKPLVSDFTAAPITLNNGITLSSSVYPEQLSIKSLRFVKLVIRSGIENSIEQFSLGKEGVAQKLNERIA